MKLLIIFFVVLLVGCNDSESTINNEVSPPEIIENSPPIINSIENIELNAHEVLSLYVQSSDVDGDKLHYGLRTKYAWITLNPESGELILKPSEKDLGVYNIQLFVSDGQHEAEIGFNVKVNDVTNIDEITVASTSNIIVELGEETFYQIEAKHNNNKPLEFILTTPLSWIKVNNHTGLLTLTPSVTDVSEIINIKVTDGTIEKDITINVSLIKPESKLRFEFTGKEAKQLFYYEITVNGTKIDGNHYLSEENPEIIFPDARPMYVGDIVELSVRKTSNNQICKVTKPTFTISSKQELIQVECLTNSTHAFNDLERSYYLEEGVADLSSYLLKNEDGLIIKERPSVEFLSSNDSIADIKEMGTYKTNKIEPKKEGTIFISAKPNENFYKVEEIQYKVNILSKANYNRMELCQVNCVDANSKYQALVGGRDVLIRIYDIIGAHTISVFDGNEDEIYTSNFNCSSNADSAKPVYDSSTCNVSLASEYVKPKTKIVIRQSESNNVILSASPNIYAPKELEITLVKVRLNVIGTDNSITGTYNLFPEEMTDDSALKEIERLFNDKLPFSKVSVRVHKDILSVDVPSLEQVKLSSILNTLSTKRANEVGTSYVHKNIYYGLVPKRSGGVSGSAFVGTGVGLDASSANVKPIESEYCKNNVDLCLYEFHRVMLHEIGHTLGLLHGKCGEPKGVDDSWQYTYWKHGAFKSALSDSPIYNQSNNTIQSPLVKNEYPLTDIMGYCAGFQFSEFNVYNILNLAHGVGVFDVKKSKKRVQRSLNLPNAKKISWEINNVQKIDFYPLEIAYNESEIVQNGNLFVRIKTNNATYELVPSKKIAFDTDNSIYSVFIPIEDQVEGIIIFDEFNQVIFQEKIKPIESKLINDAYCDFSFIDEDGTFINQSNSSACDELIKSDYDRVIIKDFFNFLDLSSNL